jgi:Cu/Ag efflux protein CusF
VRHAFSGTLVAVAIVMTAASVAAHHSFAVFDMSGQKTATGTVKRVDWTNPHIWIWIDVANDKGGVDIYGFEGMSPNYLERRGWKRTTLKAGEKVTVVYRPLRDGSNGGMFMTTKLANGTVLTMGGGEAAVQ